MRAFHFESQSELALVAFAMEGEEGEDFGTILDSADDKSLPWFYASWPSPTSIIIVRRHAGLWREIADVCRFAMTEMDAEVGYYGNWEIVPSAIEGGGVFLVESPPPKPANDGDDDPAIPF